MTKPTANKMLTHLFLGDQALNMADKVNKHRQAKGTDFKTTKLTEAQVLAIRADTRTQMVIAAEYGTSQSQVSSIKRRKTWKHLPI